MAKDIDCPVCEEKIFLPLKDSFYCYPWDGNKRIGKYVHKHCLQEAIRKGLYIDPPITKPRYNLLSEKWKDEE